eukprot:1247530-Prymnesium_polylepis.1
MRSRTTTRCAYECTSLCDRRACEPWPTVVVLADAECGLRSDSNSGSTARHAKARVPFPSSLAASVPALLS